MAERYSAFATGVASGTALAILNLYDSTATPTRRAAIYDILVGSVATPGDQAANMSACRTTAAGTAAGTFTPNNLDPAGPAGACSVGQGAFSAEPTKTANKELLTWPMNQRATFRWVAAPGSELLCAASQNAGICLQTKTSTSTQAHSATILFLE